MATNNNSLPQHEEQSSIDLKDLMFKMLDKWYYFIICLIVSILVFFIISKFTTTQYQAKATLLIKSNENALSQLTLLSNDFGKNKANFQNEIGQIQSFTMAKRTIKSLDFYVNYYQKSKFKKVEIYKESPFLVELDMFKLQTVNMPIEVKILSKEKVQISYSDKRNSSQYDYGQDMLIESNIPIQGNDETINFGQWYEKDGMRFRLLLNEEIPFKDIFTKINYSFVINDIDETAKEFNSTKIDLINKESTIINIAFNYPNQQKAIDYINMLCKLYIDLTFEEKNYMNTSTIKFVDAQIANIADSLTKTERIREEFQIRNNTIDLGGDAKFLFDKANELETKRAEEYTKRQYYDYLDKYISQADLNDGVVAPAVMGVEDVLLNSLVKELTTKLTLKKSLSLTTTPKNLEFQKLTHEINSIKGQIEENIKSLKRVSTIASNELTRQLNIFQTELNKLPSTQRNLINIERQFKFNDEIYTFLYQKRAEAEIARSSALPDHKVVDQAREANKVYPKTSLNLMIAVLLGLLIPALYIFIRHQLNNIIESKEDVEKISKSPIIGYIPTIEGAGSKLVVFAKPKSQITESFRSIRTNLKYIVGKDKNQVILITSSMPSDGKSFISINLASIISLAGHKTIIVGYDLRKPKLHNFFNLKNNIGVSTYLIGRNSLDEVIQSTEFENLDILASGPVPPNPSELIDSPENSKLIEELRQRYDAIIFDTPPVSLISDAVTLTKESDINIVVVRAGHTDKRIFNSTIDDFENRDKVKFNFILNGLANASSKYGYGSYGGKNYGYGYGKGYGNGYGYGYGYYEDDSSFKKS
ncbi:MAG: polysaccharide biosynthesis tyrosine autokinase [Bacteroidales bacterium]|nr:polysaccharide biosynthesis tyrosine autokinase [Bacteroidales bacterium]